MTARLRYDWTDADRLSLGAGFLLLVAAVSAVGAPSLYWALLAASLTGAVALLALLHPVAASVGWLVVTGLTLEMAMNDLIGPGAFQVTIAAVKGAGILLALICAWRYGPRWDGLSPVWGFAAIGMAGSMHGLYPGLTAADSLRSLFGSIAPYAFGFARVPRRWAEAIIRATVWVPSLAVAAAAGFAVAGLRPMFVESGGWRLAGLGHPAFLAGVCLPAIYAGLIELWRAGRPRDRVLLGINLLILILTGARAPLAYALAVSGMALLTAPSTMVSARERLTVMLLAALVVPILVLLAGELAEVRLFNVLTNDLGNLSGREFLWPSFEAAAASSPWVGWGLGAGNAVIPPDSPVAQMLHTWAAHNEYLRMEVEGGQAGRALLILLFGAWAYRQTARLGPAERRIMRFVLLAFAAHAFTDNVLISTPACVLFTFATAVFARGESDRRMASFLPGAM